MAMIIVSPVGVPAVIPAGNNYHISPSAETTNSSGKMGHLHILLCEKNNISTAQGKNDGLRYEVIIFPEKKIMKNNCGNKCTFHQMKNQRI